MKEKMMPHIIAIMVLVIFVILGIACASSPSVPREKQQKIRDLSKRRYPSETDWGIRRTPSENEAVLGIYQHTFQKDGSATLNEQEAQAYSEGRFRPEYSRPIFYPHEIASSLIIKASADFPEIDAEDLDVRSLEMVGEVAVRTIMNPVPIPNPFRNAPLRYSFMATETVTFRGVVVNAKVVNENISSENRVIQNEELGIVDTTIKDSSVNIAAVNMEKQEDVTQKRDVQTEERQTKKEQTRISAAKEGNNKKLRYPSHPPYCCHNIKDSSIW